VQRVLPSSRNNPASSREIQFHWIHIGDSRGIMTPFMQVGTYPTKNFATLEPLELRLPFIGGYSLCIPHIILAFQHWAGVRLNTSFYNFAEPCVFIKQLFLSFLCPRIFIILASFFLSYGGILPSSFNVINSTPVVYSTSLPVSV